MTPHELDARALHARLQEAGEAIKKCMRLADAYARAYKALSTRAIGIAPEIHSKERRMEFLREVERITVELRADMP